MNPHHPPSLPKRIGDIITYTSKSNVLSSVAYRSFDYHLQVCSNKQCFHDKIHVFFRCDYSFHYLSLRHTYLSICYTSCFYNHYTAPTMDTPSSPRVATARLTILDRLAATICHYSPLFAAIHHYSRLFALFVLFAIRFFQTHLKGNKTQQMIAQQVLENTRKLTFKNSYFSLKTRIIGRCCALRFEND